MACRTLVPGQGIELTPPTEEGEVLTTAQPRMSPKLQDFDKWFIWFKQSFIEHMLSSEQCSKFGDIYWKKEYK